MEALHNKIAQNNEAISQKFAWIDLSWDEGAITKTGADKILATINKELEQIKALWSIDDRLEDKENWGREWVVWDSNIESDTAQELRLKELIALQEKILAVKTDTDWINEESLSSLSELHEQIDDIASSRTEAIVLWILEKAIAEEWVAEPWKEWNPFYEEVDGLAFWSYSKEKQVMFSEKNWFDNELLHYKDAAFSDTEINMLPPDQLNVLYRVLSSSPEQPMTQEDFIFALKICWGKKFGDIFLKVLDKSSDAHTIPVWLLRTSFDYTKNETKHRGIVEVRTQNTFYGIEDMNRLVFDVWSGRDLFSWPWRDPETSKILIWKVDALQPGNEAKIPDFAKTILEYDNQSWALRFFDQLSFYEENAPELVEAMKWLSPVERFSALLVTISRLNFTEERDYNNAMKPVIEDIFSNPELAVGFIGQSFEDISYIWHSLDFLNLAIPSITSVEDIDTVIQHLESQPVDNNFEPRWEITWATLSSVLLLAKWRKVELEEEK